MIQYQIEEFYNSKEKMIEAHPTCQYHTYEVLAENGVFKHDWLYEPFIAPVAGTVYQLGKRNQFVCFVFVTK